MQQKQMFVGDTFETKDSGTIRVIELLVGSKAVVEFDDGNTGTFHRANIVRGLVKNYMKPIIFNRGFLGSPRTSKCRAYGVWSQMFNRCYSGKFQAYRDCTVNEVWYDFQVFRSWYEEQKNSSILGFELDKDILQRGNKIYCAELCQVIPANLNKLLESSRASRGALPLGVSLHKGTGKYLARCCDAKGGYPHIGLYPTVDEAFAAYKAAKEGFIKESAEKYKHLITSDAYDKLLLWEVKYND